ncbi:hypothetical protein [Nocardia sp. NPDC127526]|uniref:hypothetical protein n=1 Tax=Nocardia sp. NPDC127526 TaxID=3345393 RepID=UPI00363AB087
MTKKENDNNHEERAALDASAADDFIPEAFGRIGDHLDAHYGRGDADAEWEIIRAALLGKTGDDTAADPEPGITPRRPARTRPSRPETPRTSGHPKRHRERRRRRELVQWASATRLHGSVVSVVISVLAAYTVVSIVNWSAVADAVKSLPWVQIAAYGFIVPAVLIMALVVVTAVALLRTGRADTPHVFETFVTKEDRDGAIAATEIEDGRCEMAPVEKAPGRDPCQGEAGDDSGSRGGDVHRRSRLDGLISGKRWLPVAFTRGASGVKGWIERRGGSIGQVAAVAIMWIIAVPVAVSAIVYGVVTAVNTPGWYIPDGRDLVTYALASVAILGNKGIQLYQRACEEVRSGKSSSVPEVLKKAAIKHPATAWLATAIMAHRSPAELEELRAKFSRRHKR